MAKFDISVFHGMLGKGSKAYPATKQAADYLKKNRKATVQGQPSQYAVELEKVSDRNKRKSSRRYQFHFVGVPRHIPTGTACKHCGSAAQEQDHIIPHTKVGTVTAMAIAEICRKRKVKTVPSIPEFIRNPLLNRLFLCADCNKAKRDREQAIRWQNVPEVVAFYFAERKRKPKKKQATVNGNFAKRIGRAQRKINVLRNEAKQQKIDLGTVRRMLAAKGETFTRKKFPEGVKIARLIDGQFNLISRLEKERDKAIAA